jgi:hypothetical protein
MKTHRWFLLVALVAAFGLIAAACGSDDSGSSSSIQAEDIVTNEFIDESLGLGSDTTLVVEEGALAGVCPDTVIVQTDWHAEAEHGATYELLGQDYEVVETGTVRGALVANGEVDTGVQIEIREGGPAIGFQQVSAQMYQDPEIMFGYASTDEAVENSLDQPTVAVMTPLDINPQIIMWNPEQFPGVEKLEDLPDDTLIVAFGPATYLLWLVDQGIITEDQIDGSYDAGPSRFVAEDGAYGQQGFASAEPFIYEFETPEYAKAIQYEMIHDMGFEIYSQPFAVRPERIEEDRECLELLVPIAQQAAIDYVTDGAETNAVIVDVNAIYDDEWVYNIGEAEFSVGEQARLGLIGNGPNDTLGDHDMDRVQTVIDQLIPVFENLDVEIAE